MDVLLLFFHFVIVVVAIFEGHLCGFQEVTMRVKSVLRLA
jgi:hypothetical protein